MLERKMSVFGFVTVLSSGEESSPTVCLVFKKIYDPSVWGLFASLCTPLSFSTVVEVVPC